MDFRTCTKCNKEKDISCFNWRNEERGWRHSFCKECHSAYRRSHYLDNRDKYIKKALRWNKKQTNILRKFLIEYFKKNPCVDCGIDDIRVLDFDHEDDKFMGICQMVRNCYSMKAIKLEISKCKVRCANCHRIKTFQERNFWKNRIN
jgi:hypothetical protein